VNSRNLKAIIRTSASVGAMRRSRCKPRRSRDCMRTTSSWRPRSTAYSLARPRGERVLLVLQTQLKSRISMAGTAAIPFIGYVDVLPVVYHPDVARRVDGKICLHLQAATDVPTGGAAVSLRLCRYTPSGRAGFIPCCIAAYCWASSAPIGETTRQSGQRSGRRSWRVPACTGTTFLELLPDRCQPALRRPPMRQSRWPVNRSRPH
jgi:hypothetical protein